MKIDSSFPLGWARMKISHLVQPRGEKSIPSEHPNLKFIGMDDVESHTMRIISSKLSSTMKSTAARFYVGDVLYGRLRPYLNKVVQPNFNGLASAEFIVFPPNDLMVSAYLRYRLNSADFVSFANHLNEGDRPRVSFEQIGEFDLLVPPFNEQHRIVAKIEELFSEIDKGVESLKTAKAQLQVYRQALLKHAFEGKLTAQWRADNPDKVVPAAELLRSIEQAREERYQQQLTDWQTAVEKWEFAEDRKPGKPKMVPFISISNTEEIRNIISASDGVCLSALGNLIDEPKYGTSKKCSYDNSGIGVLRIPNIEGNKIDAIDLKFASFDNAEIREYSLQKGDLLIIRSNGSVSLVGKCAQIFDKDTEYLYAGYLIRLRPNPLIINSKYLTHVLSSHFLRKQIESKAKSTSGVNNINSGEIQSLLIPIHSISEQRLSRLYGDKCCLFE